MVDLNSNSEINARFSARGTYYRWLVQQYGSIPMLELQEDNQDPISLRKIFIPLRLDTEDRDESSINPPEKFHEESEENQLGIDAFDEIIEHDFLVISGRPGAGKTTLVKALINELCGTHSSKFRSRMHKKYGAIFTMPVILREIPAIEGVNSLDDLLEQWWKRLDELNHLAFERKTFTERLDLAGLKVGLRHDKLRGLILFDGIDEVGSFDVRSKIYQIAQEAKELGFRVILTGRPSGLADLRNAVQNGVFKKAKFRKGFRDIANQLVETEALVAEKVAAFDHKKSSDILDTEVAKKLSIDGQTTQDGNTGGKGLHDIISHSKSKDVWRFIQPLTRPQIDLFIKKWYQLDPTWVSKLGTHPEEFKAALADPQRDHLLPLARRPIFLSLMAIVHCTKNEMPHGRAELYKTIVDVYLTRQRKHRRLKQTTTGESMPQWDSHEPRTALGYLAWRSMHKGSEKEKQDERRILWKREDMESELREAINSTLRFSEVTADDATSLISYYLNPAGLLIEPMDGYVQFAHLSFQEYLCAEYLQGQMSGRRMEKQWREEVLAQLDSPGWQEVALLLLTVHANKTQNLGHFELISYLDISNYQQARLMFCALLGKELPVQAGDRQHWFSLLVMAALIHPKMPEVKSFQLWGDLNKIGQEFILDMLEIFSKYGGEAVWQYLSEVKCGEASLDWREDSFEDFDDYVGQISLRWKKPIGDESWIVEKDAKEAQRFSLLSLLLETCWGDFDPSDLEHPMKNEGIQVLLAEMYRESPPWVKKDEKWKVLSSHFLFENFFNYGGILESVIRESMPISLWLLMGDRAIVPSIFNAMTSRSIVNESRTRLSLAFYQWTQLLELFYSEKNIAARSKKSLNSVMLTNPDFRSNSHKVAKRWSSLEHNSSQVLASFICLVMPRLEQDSIKLDIKFDSNALHIAMLEIASGMSTKAVSWYVKNADLFSQFLEVDNLETLTKEELRLFEGMLTFVANNFAAWAWFSKQSAEHGSLKAQGWRKEFFPRDLGLFTKEYIPRQIQKRENILKLKAWVDDDENWLSFVFPKEELSAEVRKVLLNDIAELKQHSWSPYRLLDTLIDDWPESKKTYNCSIEASEKRLTQTLEKLLEK